MKTTWISAASALVLASVGLLASCGGGGDDHAGSLTALSVQPADITAVGPAAKVCATGSANVFVYGGTAPYRLDNPFPAYISLNKSRVDHRGDSFTMTFLGGCLDPGMVVVVDSLDQQVIVTLHNIEGS